MVSNVLQLNNISFAYDSFSKIIFQSVTLNIYNGWTGVIGPNGSGKTTFLKLCTNKLKPQEGKVIFPRYSVYCEQRTDNCPVDIEYFIYSYNKTAIKLKSVLEIDEEYMSRWNTLSHGERKRVQIGNALYQEPDLLAMDEPANHLDSESKEIIKKALQSFKGIGLIVSHDRDLLNSLCGQCIFIEPPDITLYRGNYTETKIQYDEHIQYNKKMYNKFQKEKRRIESIIQKRKQLAQNSDKRVSKRGINRRDHDSKAKINAARVTGKDGVGGKLVNQVQGRLNQTIEKQKKYELKKEFRTGIEFNAESSKRRILFYEDSFEIYLGEARKLSIENLNINPTDKIGVTGKNGSGKSTLINYILKNLNLNRKNILYIPQEIDVDTTKRIQKDIKNLKDDELGILMALITRLGSEPQRLLESELFSPGETRKLLFAFGVMNNPQIVIMDEPTNHLDIVAVESLENALKELSCALLLVSHDRLFLENLVNINWHIEKSGDDYILKKFFK